jgi:hypothetical protein
MHRIPDLIAALAAIAVAAVGFRYGTYAAGGSDSSCYALMADAFAGGRLQPVSDLVTQVPWPDAQKTFTPGGFVPSESRASASAPVCAPGFSLLLAPFVVIGGPDGVFAVSPIAGAFLVWFTFVAARHMAGPLAGAMAAVLVAVSPPMLFQVVQPMNDVATAALWMATFVALLNRRWALAGVSCGIALLVRPNLLPLALIAGLFIAVRERRILPVARFAFAVIPSGLLVLWLNSGLYGSPFRTGYGQLGQLFGHAAASVNAPRYLLWLVQTHTPFPLLALAAPFIVPPEKRVEAWLAAGLILSTCLVYFIYTPFDDWSYLRFLLPAIALMLVLASAVVTQMTTFVGSGFSRTVIAAGVTVGLAAFCLKAADDRLAFTLRHLEQRFRSAGIVVRDRLPASAVVLSVWDSGAVRFHGRKEALTWGGLDPAWLDRSLVWLDEHGHRPYIMLESWEEPDFRRRFGDHSDIGRLDWPPKYDIDRKVRIYDPRDRPRFDRGERIDTEYLWPLRH